MAILLKEGYETNSIQAFDAGTNFWNWRSDQGRNGSGCLRWEGGAIGHWGQHHFTPSNSVYFHLYVKAFYLGAFPLRPYGSYSLLNIGRRNSPVSLFTIRPIQIDSITYQYKVALSDTNQDWVVLSSDEPVLTQNEWVLIEGLMTLDATSLLADLAVRINGAEIYSGTISAYSSQPFDVFRYGERYGSTTLHCNIDDLIITNAQDGDVWYGGVHVKELVPVANGTHSGWTPNTGTNYQAVDEIGSMDSDATYVESATSGTKDTYDTANLTLGANESIDSVCITVYAKKIDAASSKRIRGVLIVGGSTYYSSWVDVPVDYHPVRLGDWKLNPATNLPWTEADVNGVEIGYELE